eukprot:CAMPEP_0167747604 /NCGR_PEP_ID=MMETSP0110_2-20121227/4376_1 /TAXON_ID=629695 /ORGANISM="Gymnochlora sp., Strain CCMP2014" /LENGTH=541 /DNA_ID=CAMNT_0007632529 /DNA_START=114 /DNA_END=1736 /DNA_ORIENTATION=-
MDIVAVTWNVAATLPDEDSIGEVFMASPDMYVVCIQEIVDLNPANTCICPHHASKPWEDAIEFELARKQLKYTKICVEQLVGIVMIVYLREELFPYMSSYQKDKLGVGIVRLGNKGAVAFRFELFQTTFVFINSHLTAHKEKLSKRNANYNDIVGNLCFFDDNFMARSIFDSHVLIWAGDLNYRLDYPLSETKKVISSIESKEYSPLLKKDQLKKAMNDRIAFQGLKEAGVINFAPTYKLYKRSDVKGDANEYNTKRTPSWTDRILFKLKKNYSGKGKVREFSALEYTSIKSAAESDHRPVRARFQLEVQDPQSLQSYPTSGVLMLWSVLEVAQFFVNVLQVNFHYSGEIYNEMGVQYLLGWSIGAIPSSLIDWASPREASRPELSELVGIERLSWELGIDPNRLLINSLSNFVLTTLATVTLCLLVRGVMFLTTPFLNISRTEQMVQYPWWAMFKSLSVIAGIAIYPCFTQGAFHLSFCYHQEGYKTQRTLTEAQCGGWAVAVVVAFVAYLVLIWYLWAKVPDLRSFIELLNHGKYRAVW